MPGRHVRPLWREAAIDIFIETVALTFGALLPIMNPFSTAPLFISLTAGFESRRRNRQALMACIYALAILVTFLLLGAAIIDFFGISIPGIRVAGGLIISATGFRMLFPAPKNGGSAEAEAGQQEADVAFTPIAMPSLAGPGSISVVLTAAGHIRSIRPDDWQFVYLAIIAGMALTLIFSFIVLRASAAMIRFMGPGGIDAMTRIFGFLLICIGMQFLLTGISDYFGLVHA